ncbi:hypothetical protein [Parvularcula lutaonensis]|uniref:DUF4064 domain-containing protein n=1 Tax=Parvularcula lutaonensis TaxID=491923 RepID=A0ABV7MCA0_9PROT|nr:hypothetical protein [Parvularcula lutaonensis]GGY40715.1 hypothetical protein GCM10007148_06540 [Parvularcula lutaonensis]
MEEIEDRRGGGGVWKFLLFLMVVAVALGTYAVYHFGADADIYINGRTVDELQPWEVVGGVIIGIFGLIIGLIGGAIGLLIGLGAAILAIALAMLGIMTGLFITAGVILGPFLLIAAIILLLRRRSHPEMI